MFRKIVFTRQIVLSRYGVHFMELSNRVELHFPPMMVSSQRFFFYNLLLFIINALWESSICRSISWASFIRPLCNSAFQHAVTPLLLLITAAHKFFPHVICRHETSCEAFFKQTRLGDSVSSHITSSALETFTSIVSGLPFNLMFCSTFKIAMCLISFGRRQRGETTRNYNEFRFLFLEIKIARCEI